MPPNREPTPAELAVITRTSVVEMLELLSSESAQRDYQRNVPIADVPSELICMWFDDIPHEHPIFDAAFTTPEHEAIAEFHRMYDERKKQLPEAHGDIERWLPTPAWREIMEHAGRTLAILNQCP